jgi:hypothetical protein
VLEFDYDVSQFMSARRAADLPEAPTPRRSYLLVFRATDGDQRGPLLVDELTARIVKLCDGTRTVSDVLRELDGSHQKLKKSNNIKWIEEIFVHGLISLRSKPDSIRDAPGPKRRRAGRNPRSKSAAAHPAAL